MKIVLSNTLKNAIRKKLDDVERNNSILDAYKAAQDIQKAHPEENVALEDIMSAMMAGRGSIQAIEFSPLNMVIEVIYPLSEEDGEVNGAQMPMAP
jgi:hypothetical protein